MHSKLFAVTRPDGCVTLVTPSWRAIRVYGSGAGPDAEACGTNWYWNAKRRGFLAEQEERQIAAGHPAHAVRRHIHAMTFGGLTTAEALELIRDRDCAVFGTAADLIDIEDVRDRWFRNAWRRSRNGGPISIDLKAARRIQYRRITRMGEKAKAVLKLDRWRDKIRMAKTPEELRRIWPEGLPRG